MAAHSPSYSVRYAVLALCAPALLAAQPPTPPGLAAERADFASWLETSPVSPYTAVYHQPLYQTVAFGPAADDAVLRRLPEGILREQRSRLTLQTSAGRRVVPRHRAVPFAEWRIRVSGVRGRSTLTVFGTADSIALHGWYPYDPTLAVSGRLEAPDERGPERLLGLDGIEVDASPAGTFVAELRGDSIRLRVYRMPIPGTEEADLAIFFRDGTNDRGSYPAGRFLALHPLGGDRYRADFNRARNPFCAYNTVFPCPRPWYGNEIARPIEGGERYRAPAREEP